VLTDRDRARLAPQLALMHNALAELQAAQREAAAAGQRMDNLGTDWRDRSFFGLLSHEPARARAYRDLRRERTRAAAAGAERQKRIDRLNRQLDARIEPMMPRLDPGYQDLTTAIEQCDRALRECRTMHTRIAAVDKAIQAATRNSGQASGRNSGRGDKARRAVETSRPDYVATVARARSAASGLLHALESARKAVRAAGGKAERLTWDPRLLDRMPSTAKDIAVRQRLARGRGSLHNLRRQLDRAIAAVNHWHAQTTKARRRAVAAVRDGLIRESAP
jgi:hypothetical protein